jgi:hypothetical protein
MLLEKRRSERSDIFLIVEFKPLNNATEHFLGVTNNISIDGFSLDSQILNFEKGETIKCNLTHPDSKFYVSAIGEIVWRNDFWYNCMTGIKFKEIEEDAKNRIADLVAVVKNKLNGLSFNKVGDPLMTQEDQKRSSSQANVEKKDLLLEAFQRTDKDIPESDNISNTSAEFKLCKTTDETKNNGAVEAAETVKILTSDADINLYKDTKESFYNEQALTRNIPASSQNRKKASRLYIPIVTVVIIAIGVVLYLRSGSLKERDNSIIPSPAKPDFFQQIYMDRSSVSVNDTENNKLAKKELTATARSQNAMIEENKQNRSEQPSDLSEKDIYRDGSVTTAAGHIALQKLPETEKPPTTGADNGTPENSGTKILIPDISVTTGKETESVVESKMEPVSVSSLQHKNIITYKDTFSDNVNNWDIFDTNMASTTIKNGEYLIENKRKKGPHIIFYNYGLPGDSNFVAEASIRPVTNPSTYSYGLIVKSQDNRSYGFVFGAKDALNNYTFQIRENGFYSISKYKNGALQELANGKIKKDTYNQAGINVLKMVKKDNMVQFHINNNVTAEIQDISFFGNKAGFIVDGELKIAVDSISAQIQ